MKNILDHRASSLIFITVGALDTHYHEEVAGGLTAHYDRKFSNFESKYRAHLSDVRELDEDPDKNARNSLVNLVEQGKNNHIDVLKERLADAQKTVRALEYLVERAETARERAVLDKVSKFLKAKRQSDRPSLQDYFFLYFYILFLIFYFILNKYIF